MSEEYISQLKSVIAELEELYSDSIIVLKTDIMNIGLFYVKELGVF